MNVRKVRGKVGSDLYCVKGDENLRPLAESHGTHIMTPITSLHDCITFGTTQPKQSTKCFGKNNLPYSLYPRLIMSLFATWVSCNQSHYFVHPTRTETNLSVLTRGEPRLFGCLREAEAGQAQSNHMEARLVWRVRSRQQWEYLPHL